MSVQPRKMSIHTVTFHWIAASDMTIRDLRGMDTPKLNAFSRMTMPCHGSNSSVTTATFVRFARFAVKKKGFRKHVQ